MRTFVTFHFDGARVMLAAIKTVVPNAVRIDHRRKIWQGTINSNMLESIVRFKLEAYGASHIKFKRENIFMWLWSWLKEIW